MTVQKQSFLEATCLLIQILGNPSHAGGQIESQVACLGSTPAEARLSRNSLTWSLCNQYGSITNRSLDQSETPVSALAPQKWKKVSDLSPTDYEASADGAKGAFSQQGHKLTMADIPARQFVKLGPLCLWGDSQWRLGYVQWLATFVQAGLKVGARDFRKMSQSSPPMPNLPCSSTFCQSNASWGILSFNYLQSVSRWPKNSHHKANALVRICINNCTK